MIPNDTQHTLLAVLAVLALLGLVAVVRGTRTQTRAAARAVYCGPGVLSMAGRTVVTAGVILAVQWLVITYADHRGAAYWLTLAVPALLAGFTVVRGLTVTVVATRRGGGR